MRSLQITDEIQLQLRGNTSWEDGVYSYFGDINTKPLNSESEISLSAELISNMKVKNGKESSHPDLLQGDGWFYDKKYNTLVHPQDGEYHLKIGQFNLDWLIWCLQLLSLKSSSSFCHSAAVERNGNAILFPSWGGVGKTTITSGLIKKEGLDLLGDDLNIISKNGSVVGFPKEMVIYPYHSEVFPEVFSSGEGPPLPNFLTDSLSKVYSKVRPVLRNLPQFYYHARKINPQSTKIPPSEVFNENSTTESAEVDSVVWLNRVTGLNKPELKKSDKDMSSKILGSTAAEFDPHCLELSNVAMGLGIIDSELVYSQWYNVISEFLSSAEIYELCLPSSMTGSKTVDATIDLLSAEGVI